MLSCITHHTVKWSWKSITELFNSLLDFCLHVIRVTKVLFTTMNTTTHTHTHTHTLMLSTISISLQLPLCILQCSAFTLKPSHLQGPRLLASNYYVNKSLWIFLQELRDNGKCFILKEHLVIQRFSIPLSKETATGATMFIQGVGLAPVSVPLHTVFLHCDLVTGPVVVGRRPSFQSRGFPYF